MLLVLYGPFWNHLKEGWDARHHPNFRFFFYEDLKNDTFNQVKKLNQFLGTNRSDEQIKNVSLFFYKLWKMAIEGKKELRKGEKLDTHTSNYAFVNLIIWVN